ncbi:MAG TPA: hypothetical protein VKB88_00010 [Bryobacteraceae bacterium]|nr:hypothetical protein [Bryobacteraceae bacterium]
MIPLPQLGSLNHNAIPVGIRFIEHQADRVEGAGKDEDFSMPARLPAVLEQD